MRTKTNTLTDRMWQLSCLLGLCLLAGIYANGTLADAKTEQQAGFKNQKAVAANGIFWKAEYSNGSAYLLGSVHFAHSGFYPLAGKIMDAWKQSRVLLVEMDDQATTQEQQQKVMATMGLYPPGQSIRQHVSSKTLKLIASEMTALGMPLTAVERFRPGFLMITAAALQGVKLGYTPDYGIDQYFLNLARGNKPILEIESFAEQMVLLSEIPEDDKVIYDTFAKMPENAELWKAMEIAWQRGDKDALYNLAIADPLKESPESIALYDVLFFKRNIKMADAVTQCVTAHQRCFVVVGAGHLVGPKSVADVLLKRGVKVISK